MTSQKRLVQLDLFQDQDITGERLQAQAAAHELLQAQAAARRLMRYSLPEHANLLGHLLVVEKRLPNFYFNQAALEMGEPAQAQRCWSPKAWPLRPRQDEDRLRSILQVLLKVYLRLCRYPETETYAGATERLKDRIGALKEKGFSHNRIAQHLRMSHRTLADITGREVPGRPRHCPWEMLERLEDAETGIIAAVHRSLIRRPPRQAGPTLEDLESAGLLQRAGDCIRPGQGCLKCGAAWTHLYENGRNARGIPVYTCRTCGRDNPVNLPEEEDEDETGLDFPPPEEFIQRYAPCRKCGAPWHNLGRDGVDPRGNTVYTCAICAHRNRVAPKPKAVAA